MLLLAAIGVVVALGVIASVRDSGDERRTSLPAASAPINARRPQPPGPAPAGKVWSAEHGHWHDQTPTLPTSRTASPVQVQTSSPAFQTKAPQPPGPAPAGKVWSPEHGHWHDAPKQ